ncbi:MAG: RNA polymerase sigma factor [Clostridia bacterium]|nr:RNA polymerase sigma factor [Clostridia bacterium]
MTDTPASTPLDPSVVESYIDRIYAYAFKRSFTDDEAEDLSQEILLTVLRELPKLRNPDRFEPWLWGVAENVTRSYRRRMGKQRAMFFYGEAIHEDMADQDDLQEEENQALYAHLREKIAMLSAIYRDIIILHYYDGLSTKEISERLNLPEGTVTWRLAEARRKLKKECMNMEETALRPVRMYMDIYGSGNYDGKTIPFPSAYIDDALSQNILFHCYEKPCTIEELAKLCGVPAFYVEERMDNLIRREAVIQPTKHTYRTDFLIWSDQYSIYCEENAEPAMAPVADRMLQALRGLAEEVKSLDFYRAGRSEKDLFYLYSILAMEHMQKINDRLPYPPISERYDGYHWRYIASMETGKHPSMNINNQNSQNQRSRGHYSHNVYGNWCGLGFRPMMGDWLINACEDILLTDSSKDTTAVALGIQGGYIQRLENGSFRVLCPALSLEQKKAFDALAEKHLTPLMEAYNAAVERFLVGYRKLFPAHLAEDADRMCHRYFTDLLIPILAKAQRTGLIEKPSPDAICDVMLQWKK